MSGNLNPVFEAQLLEAIMKAEREPQLEAIAEAHWHPATERPTRCAIPVTTSTEAQLIRQASEPWQRRHEAMRRHEARRAWLMAGFSVCLAILAIWITRGQ